MTYLRKGTVDVQDYWAFLDSLNNVWGPGSGSSGYGQPVLSNTLSSTSTITASQWATLISRLDTVRNHQIGSTSGISAPTAGNTIAFSETLRGQIDNIKSNRFSTNTRGTALPTALGNPAISNANVWAGSAVKEFNVTFSNNDAARWFFNSGGLVTLYGNLVGNTNQKGSEWYNLLNTTLGTVSIGANAVTRSGTGGDTGGDYYQTYGDLPGDYGLTYGYNGYIWATGSGSTNADPRRWYIEGSNDLNRWATLDFVSDLAVTSSRNTYVSPRQFPHSSFRYLRWVTYGVNNSSAGWQASEFTLQRNNANVSMSNVTVTSNFPEIAGREVSKLIDGSVNSLPRGEQAYTTAGTFTWTAPADVTSVSVVCVGGGGGGSTTNGSGGGGGGGGGLGWKNNITVVPGESYEVRVGSQGGAGSGDGSNGGNSYFISSSIVQGNGGGGATSNVSGGIGGTGGGYVGDGGGNGGNGGNSDTASAGGGGGAGGYSGNGGAGGATGLNGGNGSGGGAGGGGAGGSSDAAGAGGGVGILGRGSSGEGGGFGGSDGGSGFGGSGGDRGALTIGSPSFPSTGGNYGGGGGGAELAGENGQGGVGAVRIIWGGNRAFPSTNTGDGQGDVGDNPISTVTTGPWIVTFDLGNTTDLYRLDVGGWRGAPIINNIGYSNLTSTYSTLLQVGSTTENADYSQNYITIEGKTVDNGMGVRVSLTDAAADFMSTGTSLDFVNGNLQVYAGFTPPETTFLSNVWGAPSLTVVRNRQQ